MSEFVLENYPWILILLLLAALFCFLVILAKLDWMKNEILQRVTMMLRNRALDDDAEPPTVPTARPRPRPRQPNQGSREASPPLRSAAQD